MNFEKKRDIKKISISIDKKLDDNLKKKEINKSKLVNFLIKEFFNNTDFEKIIKKFQKSS